MMGQSVVLGIDCRRSRIHKEAYVQRHCYLASSQLAFHPAPDLTRKYKLGQMLKMDLRLI